jgi:hypothetical protein
VSDPRDRINLPDGVWADPEKDGGITIGIGKGRTAIFIDAESWRVLVAAAPAEAANPTTGEAS